MPRTSPHENRPSEIDRFVSAADGLKLHYVEYDAPTGGRADVICLPGLARTAMDFEPLARLLAFESEKPRRVLALDYRGRGLSDYDPNWRNYNAAVEIRDIASVLTAAGVSRAIVIGTSRGGLHAMAMAEARPSWLIGCVLNDVGPVIELIGLARIKGYVGKLPRPQNWEQAVAILKSGMATQFTALSAADWLWCAQTTFKDQDGLFFPRYDTALSKTLDMLEIDLPLAPLWPQFEALAQHPVLVVRGAHSDLLSAETFAAMQSRSAKCKGLIIPGQGHAPLLNDAYALETIAAFIDTFD